MRPLAPDAAAAPRWSAPLPAGLTAVAVLTMVVSLTGAGCTPDTDLVDEPPRGALPGPLAPAGVALIEPPAGASDVPPNLAAVVVRFPSPVRLPEGALRLCRAAGDEELLSGPGAPATCAGAATCYRLPVAGSLPGDTTCAVAIRAPLVLDSGVALAAGVVGQFDTAPTPDEVPPQILALTIQPAGACLTVQFVTDEPATAEVILRAGVEQTVTVAGVGATNFALSVAFRGLPADTEATVTVGAHDRAGNRAETAPLAITTPPATLPLVITEVLPNPAGREPDQEYVEIRNRGAQPVSLDGLALEDSRGADPLPGGLLAPGAYALIVPSGWDPASAQDVAARASATVLRVDTRLGADGLSNAGEVVRLRGPGSTGVVDLAVGTILSTYGGWVDATAASWSGRGIHRLDEGGCDHPAQWNRTPTPATPGWGLP